MRKGLILLSVFVLVVGVYGLSWAKVAISKHDFGTSTSSGSKAVGYAGDPGGQICRACHIPHKSLAKTAMSSVAEYWDQNLLWRQTQYEGGIGFWATGAFWYTGWRKNDSTVSPQTYNDLDAASKACLGCHDGQNFYLWNTAGGAQYSTAKITTAGAIKTDLTNDHPVGIKYDPAFAPGGELESKDNAEADGIVFADGGSAKIGCGSCHDPHNKLGQSNFVRVSMSASSLCLACHTK